MRNSTGTTNMFGHNQPRLPFSTPVTSLLGPPTTAQHLQGPQLLNQGMISGHLHQPDRPETTSPEAANHLRQVQRTFLSMTALTLHAES